MIGEEMRTGRVQKFVDLSGDTKRQLQSIYRALSQALPDDQSGERFMRLAEAATNEPLIRGTKRLLQAITQAAMKNVSLQPPASKAEGHSARLSGDALCDDLVRLAAGMADTLPDDVAPQALLLALAIGMDDADGLLSIAEARQLAQVVESRAERAVRVAALGDPTLLGRRDLARRFFAAAYLSSALGADAANEACLAREAQLARQGSFSFALVAADRAGIRWGNDVNRGRFKLRAISSNFSGAILMPSVEGLPAELLPAQLSEQFGSTNDNRFRQQLTIIDQQIKSLLPYGGQ
jgi:hypothetical protein